MAYLGTTFRREDLPQSDYTPIPDGWYNAMIVGSTLSDTQNGTGQYIKLKLDITGPTHQGRSVWHNLNIANVSSDAERIGRQQLRSILDACNIDEFSDTDELINLRVAIKVSMDKDGKNNVVKAFKPSTDAIPPMAQKPQQAPQQQPQQAPQRAQQSSPPPWK